MSGPQISVTNYVQAGAWMQSPIYQFTPTRQLQYTTSSDLFQYVVNATTNPFIALTIGSDGTLITAGMITTPSLTLNGTLLAIGGTCAAGDFVNTISAAGTPACATPAGGAAGVTSFNTRTGAVVLTQADVTAVANAVYAPLTNPVSGQNNYAPIASPALTGTVGIGQAAPASPTMLSITSNVNASTNVVFQNNSTGAAAQTYFKLANSSSESDIIMEGTGYAGTAQQPADAMTIITSGAGGIAFSSNSATAPIRFFINGAAKATYSPSGVDVSAFTIGGVALGGTCAAGNFVNSINAGGVPSCATPAAGSFAPLTNPAGGQNNYAPIGSPTFTGNVVINNTTAPSLFWPATGNATNSSIDSYTYGTANIISGGYSVSATQYRAATAAAYGVSAIRFYLGNIDLTVDSVTTAGTTFTPTTRLQLSNTGIDLGYPTVGSSSDATIKNDLGGTGFTVAAGGSQALTQTCGGFWLVVDTTNGRTTGMYICSGVGCNLVPGSSAQWVASTTTPAANQNSIALSGGSATLFNGWSTTNTYRQISVCP
jgi:hypothetical protein